MKINKLLESKKRVVEDTAKEWRPNTSFNHIKDIYNKVKANDYKYVNNEREEFMAAVKKADAKGYKPEQCRQIKDWHREIWQHNRKPVDEAFNPSDNGIQSVKCYNQYNYTIQELRVDNDNKTFERGQFTAGKPDKKTKNRQEFEDIVDSLKKLGYTEVKSDYRSMRNKSRNGVPTNEEVLHETEYGKDELWNQLNNNEYAYRTLANVVKNGVEKGYTKTRLISAVSKAIFSMKDDFGRLPTTREERLELAKDFVEDETQGYSYSEDENEVSFRRKGEWAKNESKSIKISKDSPMREIDIEDNSEVGAPGHPIKRGLGDPSRKRKYESKSIKEDTIPTTMTPELSNFLKEIAKMYKFFDYKKEVAKVKLPSSAIRQLHMFSKFYIEESNRSNPDTLELKNLAIQIANIIRTRSVVTESKPIRESRGTIFTYCDYCGSRNSVEVNFPHFNRGFEDTTYRCSKCGEENKLTDSHKYNDDGTIVESENVKTLGSRGKKLNEGHQPADEWWLKVNPGDTDGANELKGLFVDDMIKDKGSLEKYGLSDRLTKELNKVFANYGSPIETPKEQKWQYSVGGKDVSYTSYEDAIAHLEDDYNIEDYREELQAYLDKETGRPHKFFVDATFDGRLCIDISWGDWKHEHWWADKLVKEFFTDKGLGIRVDVDTYEENGGDAYSAIHYYSINDLHFSGRVIKECKDEGNSMILNEKNYSSSDYAIAFEKAFYRFGGASGLNRIGQIMRDACQLYLKKCCKTEQKRQTFLQDTSEMMQSSPDKVRKGLFSLERYLGSSKVTRDDPLTDDIKDITLALIQLADDLRRQDKTNVKECMVQTYESLRDTFCDALHYNPLTISRNAVPNKDRYIDDDAANMDDTVAISDEELNKYAKQLAIKLNNSYKLHRPYRLNLKLMETFISPKGKKEVTISIGLIDTQTGDEFGWTQSVPKDAVKTIADLKAKYEKSILATIGAQVVSTFGAEKATSESIEEGYKVDDLKAYYNSSTSLQDEYPNFFAWYDYMVKSGKITNEDVNTFDEYDDDFDYDMIHTGLYGGDTMYCRVCGTKKQSDEGYPYCPTCNASFDEEDQYELIKSKRVMDLNGEDTDYTMYMNINTGEYVFVFGDKNVYTPEDGHFDWECETKEEAEEWFDNYNGFDDSDDDLDWFNESLDEDDVIHKKSDGSYLIRSSSGDGYTAYNRSDVCIGHISGDDDEEAKKKFDTNRFDESILRK